MFSKASITSLGALELVWQCLFQKCAIPCHHISGVRESDMCHEICLQIEVPLNSTERLDCSQRPVDPQCTVSWQTLHSNQIRELVEEGISLYTASGSRAPLSDISADLSPCLVSHML